MRLAHQGFVGSAAVAMTLEAAAMATAEPDAPAAAPNTSLRPPRSHRAASADQALCGMLPVVRTGQSKAFDANSPKLGRARRLGTTRGLALGSLALGLIVGAPSSARAEEKAQSLYDRGLAEMLAERYESGCPLLERSYAEDPLPGAAFTLAACYARWGKLHTAAARYNSFLAMVQGLPAAERAEQKDRIATAREKLAELVPQIPALTLTIGATPPVDAVVTLDGRPLGPAEIGAPLQVDPGDHEISVRRSDDPVARQMSVSLEPGARRNVDLADLLAEPGDGAVATESDSGEAAGPGDGDTLRAAGIAVGAVGLAGIVVGAITGGLVFGQKSTVEDNCTDAVCNQEGLDAAEQATTLATVSNVGFGVGLGALAVGVVLYLVAPDGDDAGEADAQSQARLRPAVSFGPTGRDGALIGVTGRF